MSHGLLRFAAAFTVVVSSSAAGFAYMMLFADEIDPKNAVNVGQGALAPMYRHWVEYVIVVWTSFLLSAIAFYSVCGERAGVQINWSVGRWFFFRLHFISGALILTGLLVALVSGQRLHWRDFVTAFIGLALFGMTVWDRIQRHGHPFAD